MKRNVAWLACLLLLLASLLARRPVATDSLPGLDAHGTSTPVGTQASFKALPGSTCLTWMFHDGIQGLCWYDERWTIKLQQHGKDVAWWYEHVGGNGCHFYWIFDGHRGQHGLFADVQLAPLVRSMLAVAPDSGGRKLMESTFYGRFTALHLRLGSVDRLLVFNSCGTPADRTRIRLLSANRFVRTLMATTTLRNDLKSTSMAGDTLTDRYSEKEADADLSDPLRAQCERRDADTVAQIRMTFKD